MRGCEGEKWEWMECNQCFPSKPFLMLTVKSIFVQGVRIILFVVKKWLSFKIGEGIF